MALACPGCGFRTIGEDLYGSYEICPVCGWEDDAVQLANPCSGGGANRESLLECQRAIETFEKEEMRKFERDVSWRPLSEEEAARFTSIAKQKHWTFKGQPEPEFAYWQKTARVDPL